MEIQFRGMQQNFYQADENAPQFITFLDMDIKGGMIKLASSEVDFSKVPYLEPVKITAIVKGSAGKNGVNYWVQAATVEAISVNGHPKTKGGE